MHLERLFMFAALLLGVWLPPAMAGEQGNWYFRVYLDDKPIGYHEFNVANGVVESRAVFNVKVLFFNAYSYQHNNRERWQEGCLVQIKSETSDNGDEYSVTGTVDENSFLVSTQTGEAELHGCVRSFAYWNPALLDVPALLNTQTGEYQNVALDIDDNTEFSFKGRTIPAKRYTLRVEGREIEIWYGLSGEWLALNAKTESGRTLRYVREPAEEMVQLQTNTDKRGMP
jgi:hypothetical protein